MSTRSWTVDVAGGRRTITIEHDWQVGKATIRVDGRIAAKPMSEDENEREITVGDKHYIIRRLDDDWDLDISPETFVARRTTAHSTPLPPPKKSGMSTGRIIGITVGVMVVAIAVAGFMRAGREGFAYMNVPWKPYASPDGTFQAQFPGDPRHESESMNLNGDIWLFVSLLKEYKNHHYAVEYVDLKMVVTDSQSRGVMERFFTDWMQAMGGKVETTESTTVSRNPAMNFSVVLPKGSDVGGEKLKVDARMRGQLVIRNRRLLVAWTMTAAADPYSSDLKDFMAAFKVPPPPAKPTTLF